jgi:hypothetical protein
MMIYGQNDLNMGETDSLKIVMRKRLDKIPLEVSY